MSDTFRRLYRRTFLKLCLAVPTLPLFFKEQTSTNAQHIQESPQQQLQQRTYGSGGYGTGSYPGYQVTLPIVYRKEP